MEPNLATTKTPYNDDLATYLDKLLRQDYRHPPQAPSRPSWEHTQGVLRPNRPEVPPPTTDKPMPPEALAPAASPKEAKPPKSVPDQKPKRSKRVLRSRRAKTRRKKSEKPRDVRQIVTAVLIPVLAIALLVLVRKPGGQAARTPPVGLDTGIKLNQTDSEIEIDWEFPPLYQATGRDPMALVLAMSVAPATPERPATTNRNLVIKGILYSQDKPMAIIGTQLMREGDTIAGATIMKIERDTIEFQTDGQTWKQTVTAADGASGKGTK